MAESRGLQEEMHQWSGAVDTAVCCKGHWVTLVQVTAIFPGQNVLSVAFLGRGQLKQRLRAAVGWFVSGLPVLKFHSNWVRDSCRRCPESGHHGPAGEGHLECYWLKTQTPGPQPGAMISLNSCGVESVRIHAPL